jgi:hypothetical protein
MKWKPSRAFVLGIIAISILVDIGLDLVAHLISPTSVYTANEAGRHWLLKSASLGFVYGTCALIAFVVFWKRFSVGTILVLILNVVTAWGLMVLYLITSDPLIDEKLAQLGLGAVKWVSLAGGIAWFAAMCYSFARSIDAPLAKRLTG